MPDAAPANPVLLRLVRGAAAEAFHRGAYAVVEDGRVVSAAGGVEWPAYVRSGAKPFQALTPLARDVVARFGLADRHVAILSASHGGEPAHVEAVQEMLAAGGLEAEALRCGAHPPLAGSGRRALVASGARPSVLHNNCSGKHTGMLLAARAAGESLEDYLDPEHPLQRENRRVLARHADLEPEEIGVAIDGCSAPTFVLPLDRMALAFSRHGRIGDAPLDQAAASLRAAIRSAPEFMGGSRHFDTLLPRATQGRWMAKVGAEGFYGAWAADRPVGIAVHVDDGNYDAACRILLGLLLREDWVRREESRELLRWADPVRRNHAGRQVGEMALELPG